MGKMLVAVLVALAAGFGTGYAVRDSRPQRIKLEIPAKTNPYSKFFK